jgi:hypothetical protein
MKLSEVPIVEVVESVRVPTFEPGTETTRGTKRWVTETRVSRLYDFGAFSRADGQHEEHVLYHVEEFRCDQHDLFKPGCEACYEAAYTGSNPKNPNGPLAALWASRDIKVEPA